jgi:uncharacterized protein (TIGR01370 family)
VSGPLITEKFVALPYLYQLQHVNYDKLSNTDFEVAVIDMDDAALSRNQVETLQDQGSTLFSYLSIGEAESFRDYWGNSQPDYVIDSNPDWEGAYRVEFWDPEWQQIVMQRVEQAVENGYNGIYLDIVDGYQVDSVKAAYNGPDIREEMISFVKKISEHGKSLNPDFKIIPQNAVGLLADEQYDPSTPNSDYLAAIDGLGVESLWYADNQESSWTRWDLDYIKLAQDEGKFVLATSYPTDPAKQADFIDNAVAEGFIPYVATRALDGTVIAANQDIPSNILEMTGFPQNDAPAETAPAPAPTPMEETVDVETTAPVDPAPQPAPQPSPDNQEANTDVSDPVSPAQEVATPQPAPKPETDEVAVTETPTEAPVVTQPEVKPEAPVSQQPEVKLPRLPPRPRPRPRPGRKAG